MEVAAFVALVGTYLFHNRQHPRVATIIPISADAEVNFLFKSVCLAFSHQSKDGVRLNCIDNKR